MVQFPLLQRVKVEGFQLYPGPNNEGGLDHVFQPGVNVIVGINGLGKTTLLNVLLRGLTGPYDFNSVGRLGDRKRNMGAADKSFFRTRVPDAAVSARAIVEFWLGDSFFTVKRSLENLDLVALEVDQQPIQASSPRELEGLYQERVRLAAGLSRFDDFVFLLRFLIFFLEDRRNLVWDEGAQAEILGVLFGQEGERERFVELFNELASLDSQWRNVHAQKTKFENHLSQQAATIAGGQIQMLQKQLDEGRSRLTQITKERDEKENQRVDIRQALENSKRERFDLHAQLTEKLDTFYASFFPTLNDAARYLLSHFDTGAGCLICGATSAPAKAAVQAKVEMNTCPVCASPLEKGENEHVHDPYEADRIDQAQQDLTGLDSRIQALEIELRAAEKAYLEVASERVVLAQRIVNLESELGLLGNSLPEVQKQLDKSQSQVSVFKTMLDAIETKRAQTAAEFQKLARELDASVQQVSQRIETSFAKFIRGFLAEECSIKYRAGTRTVGEKFKDAFPFPQFVPALTSGVFRAFEAPRQQSTSVSESQSEFIDLAFRMAIMEVAAPEMPSMLVLETPEASLDSVFVPRAAELLRRFAHRSAGASQTRLIATSNVNKELMIPALFGVYPDLEFAEAVIASNAEAPEPIPEDRRHLHVLDLLTVAAPTRALEVFRVPYERERDKAIYPERELRTAT